MSVTTGEFGADPRRHHEELAFCTVIEPGDFESKVELLVESIRQFGGRYKSCPIFTINPRGRGPLRRHTQKRLRNLDAIYVDTNINRTWKHYGAGNKIYASSLVEEWTDGWVDTLVWIDGDTIVLNSPAQLLLEGRNRASALPVGSTGIFYDPKLNEFWNKIDEACGSQKIGEWGFKTTVTNESVGAYFNAGVVACRPSHGIFRQWLDNLERAAAMRIERFADSRKLFNLDQALLGKTLLRMCEAEEFKTLPITYNYPMTSHKVLPRTKRVSTINEIVVCHYHDLFYSKAALKHPLIKGSNPYESWLYERIPISKSRSRWLHRKMRRAIDKYVTRGRHEI